MQASRGVYDARMSLGTDLLRELIRTRDSQGLSESEIAYQLGITPSRWSMWKKRGEVSKDGLEMAMAFVGTTTVVDGEGAREVGKGRAPRGAIAAAPRKQQSAHDFDIPLLESRASMGSGVPLADQVNVLEMVSANLPELRRRVSFSAPQNLRLLTGYGDSMAPTFSDGDILLIDVGVTDLKLDAVYVLERHDQLFVKRIQRSARGGYRMISDNTVYPPEDIDPERDGFSVVARVVCVWNMRKL